MKSARYLTVLVFVPLLAFAPRVLAQTGSLTLDISAGSSINASTSAPGPAQAPTQTKPAGEFKNHFLWTEEFSGSGNAEGQVMTLDSTIGYVISRHFGVDAGIPVYFVHDTFTTSSGGTASTSNNGLGDAYLQLRLAFENPVMNYKAVLTGAAPTGSTSAGLSTGHATYDWTNHFDHRFGDWVPFAEAGIGDSIPANFVFNRPYASFGHDLHFQGGVSRQFADWLSVSASAYDVAPWGAQTIVSRLVGPSGPPVGKGGHGRVFDLSHQTTGGAILAADNGFSAGADISAGPAVDFSLGFTHSIHFQLNTVTFGIGVNMSELLRRASAGR